jgi:hypothetical protein
VVGEGEEGEDPSRDDLEEVCEDGLEAEGKKKEEKKKKGV